MGISTVSHRCPVIVRRMWVIASSRRSAGKRMSSGSPRTSPALRPVSRSNARLNRVIRNSGAQTITGAFAYSRRFSR
ncbi:MAG TPA: hypothetical protein DD658_02310 [Deltaproteobacteria bacterium]|nr:hypothetical protein [Deltaproteobacteria bacterium]